MDILTLFITTVIALVSAGILPVKYRKPIILVIALAFASYLSILCINSCKPVCSFNCSSIDSLKTVISIQHDRVVNEVESLQKKVKGIELEDSLNSSDNHDSIYNIHETIRVLRYNKVYYYEMLEASLNKLNNECDGCRKSKQKYDSLLNKYNSINEN